MIQSLHERIDNIKEALDINDDNEDPRGYNQDNEDSDMSSN